MAQCVRAADMIFNCRDFYDQDASRREQTKAHIGSHHILMSHLVQYRQFFGYLRGAGACVRRAEASRVPNIVFAAWCRAGEKRSVAMAVHLWHAISEVAGLQGELIHLCDAAWGRYTCAGTCPQCRSPLRRDMRETEYVRQAIDAFRDGYTSRS